MTPPRSAFGASPPGGRPRWPGKAGSTAALALALLWPALVAAQSVALQGMMGNRALLIIDGSPPRGVAPGDTHQGVKVLTTTGEFAVKRQQQALSWMWQLIDSGLRQHFRHHPRVPHLRQRQ